MTVLQGIGILCLFFVLVVSRVLIDQSVENSKKKKLERKREFDAKPVPRCGDKVAHYGWEADQFPCPVCCALDRNKSRYDEQSELADMIATRVAARLNQEPK